MHSVLYYVLLVGMSYIASYIARSGMSFKENSTKIKLYIHLVSWFSHMHSHTNYAPATNPIDPLVWLLYLHIISYTCSSVYQSSYLVNHCTQSLSVYFLALCSMLMVTYYASKLTLT